MFTGIIEDVGVVRKCTTSALIVGTRLAELETGDSVSVNGTCLTVAGLEKSGRAQNLGFDVSPETLRQTNLGELKAGSKVNLERALRVGDRFGGHMMTGHIEETARLVQKTRVQNSWEFAFAFDRRMRAYIVPRGSVGVDGISLTVTACGGDRFTVSVIPHTMRNTNLASRRVGDKVNLEPDILAKYTESILNHAAAKTKSIEDYLREYGFIK